MLFSDLHTTQALFYALHTTYRLFLLFTIYKLFFDLRNPSAHSYGNIHYELERNRTVQAQCFAAIIIREYFCKHTNV